MATPSEEAVAPRHRRWPRRLLIAANIFVALCVLVTASGYAYVRIKFDQIPRFAQPLDLRADRAPTEPMNVLVVGSDTRSTVSPEERKSFGSEGQVPGQRSDTIILLRVDPKANRAAMLSIPRDLYVPIVGTNGSGRINSAFEAGPDRLIQTVNQALGIPIDHYVQVDFNGFRGIVSAVGGVQVYSPAKARDRKTGLNIPNPGCVTLDGDQALAFVRSREYEYFENGKWRSDPTGDIGRIQRQQDFVRRVIKRATEKARGLNVPAVGRLVNVGIKNVQVDENLDDRDVVLLASRFKSIDPNSVQMLTVPTVDANIGGAAVLRMKQPDAQHVIDTFLAKPPAAPAAAQSVPNIPPGAIRVRVLNGSGAEGQAREVGKQIGEAGFVVSGLGQAESFRFADTVIAYARGQQDKALVVQSRVLGGSALQEDATIRGVDVVVTTGGNFGGIAGAAPGAAPATTAAPAGGKPATKVTEPPPVGPQC